MRIRLDGKKDWSTTATVKKAEPAHRSYVVETQQGTYQRNCRHLQLTPSLAQQKEPFTDVELARCDLPEAAIDVSAAAMATIMSTVQPTEFCEKTPDQPSTPVKTSYGRSICRPLKFQDFVC